MGMLCLCGCGEKSCGICGACGGCLAGNGDDDFFPATKEQIIERLDRDQYCEFWCDKERYIRHGAGDSIDEAVENLKKCGGNGDA